MPLLKQWHAQVTASHLLAVPEGLRTEATLRTACSSLFHHSCYHCSQKGRSEAIHATTEAVACAGDGK